MFLNPEETGGIAKEAGSAAVVPDERRQSVRFDEESPFEAPVRGSEDAPLGAFNVYWWIGLAISIGILYALVKLLIAVW